MAFTPILSNQGISYASARSQYRNSARESLAGGTPVFFVPTYASLNDYGYGGPKYRYGYTYYNSDSNIYGNCTWWCWARLYQTMGTALPNYGDGRYWYDSYNGSKERHANNIQPGDIIVLDDGDAGHVMFVEQVDSDGTIHISQSAYSSRSVWSGMSCLVNTYNKSEIYQGSAINIYRNIDTAYYQTVVGVIHTGESGPAPTPDTPEITISPPSYNVTMDENSTYVDFPFNITISGIPDGESVSGGNTYPGLTRIANTGWSYESYTSGGVTYRRATKSQTLRYQREQNIAYTTTKHMYFDIELSNGSIHSDTAMVINVLERKGGAVLFLEWDGGYAQII